jgi:hypothetical protein
MAVPALPTCASAATLYVDGSVGASGDCLSTASACKTIADAIPKERATPEADTIQVGPGTYVENVRLDMGVDGGLTIAGAGSGTDPSTNTLVENTSGTGSVLYAASPNTLLKVRGLRVVAGGTSSANGIQGAGTALSIGTAAAPVVVDMANPSSSAFAISTGQPAGSTSSLDHVTVGGTWSGNGLTGGWNTTISDSRIVTSPSAAAVPALLGGPGTTVFRRSVIQNGNAGTHAPAVSSTVLDVVIDSSEILGGGGVFLSASGGATQSLTVIGSTIDSGVLGNRDGPDFPDVTIQSNSSGTTTTASVQGSILIEPPRAVGDAGASETVTCSNTEVPGTSQAAASGVGQIDCATGANGNTFTERLEDLFANPAPDYTLKPGSSAIDSVPEPAGVTSSTTDLIGAPRVLNGADTCAAPLRDKGALELAGHAGVVPDATIGAPAAAIAGSPVSFSGSAPNQAAGVPLTFGWAFSDGATASGATVSHAFAATGPAGATLTVTAPGGCVGTAATTLAISVVVDTITGLKIAPATFAAARSGPSVRAAAAGAVVTYSGNQAATTAFTVQHVRKGRKRAGKCGKPTRRNRHGKRCSYYTGAGSFKHVDAAGAIRFRFTGRVKGRALRPGAYRLKAVPHNAAGAGRAAYAKFRVKKR